MPETLSPTYVTGNNEKKSVLSLNVKNVYSTQYVENSIPLISK